MEGKIKTALWPQFSPSKSTSESDEGLSTRKRLCLDGLSTGSITGRVCCDGMKTVICDAKSFRLPQENLSEAQEKLLKAVPLDALFREIRVRLDAMDGVATGVTSFHKLAGAMEYETSTKIPEVASSTFVINGREFSCQICLCLEKHSDPCPFLQYVPPNSTVGPKFLVKCGNCGIELPQPTTVCRICHSERGQAVEASTFRWRCRNYMGYDTTVGSEVTDSVQESEPGEGIKLPVDPEESALVFGPLYRLCKGFQSFEKMKAAYEYINSKAIVKAASSTTPDGLCQICLGVQQHIDGHCPFLDFVPPGSIVGPDYLVICDDCGYELLQPTEATCWQCCKWGGIAVAKATFDKSYRNYLAEQYTAVENEDE